MERGQEMIQATTTDYRLLAGRGGTDWVHTDPWRVLRMQSEFVEGFGTLAELGPAVTVFGSARTRPETPEYAAGVELGRRIAEAGFAVITGGGPGVMEAANKGATEAGGVSVGLGIELPFETGFNDWVNLGIYFRYFFVRKVMFLKYAAGVIALPGGVGTMDELFEVVTLVQTGKLSDFPILLYGTDYWLGILGWMRDTMLAEHYISAGDLDLFQLTDDLDEIVAAVTESPRARILAGTAEASTPGRPVPGARTSVVDEEGQGT